MHQGRFTRSVIAIGALYFLTNLEMAYADDPRLTAPVDGSCGNNDTSGHGGGGHGCGFLGLGCVGDAIAHAWDDTGGKVVHAVASAPWGRIGSDAWGFVTGLAVGAAIGVGIALLAVSAPIWVTVTLAVVGLGLLAYGIYNTVANWNNISESQKFNLLGNAVGGIVGGWGTGSLLSSGDATVTETGATSSGASAPRDVAPAAPAAGRADPPIIKDDPSPVEEICP